MLENRPFEVDLQRIACHTVGRGLVGGDIDDGDHVPQFEAAVRGHGDACPAGIPLVPGQDSGCSIACGRGRGDGGIVADVQPFADQCGLGRRDGVAGNGTAGQIDADYEGTVDQGGVLVILRLKDGMEAVGPAAPAVVETAVKGVGIKHQPY